MYLISSLQKGINPEGFSIVSFDVKSLCTTMPLNFALDSIRTAVSEDDSLMQRTSLDRFNNENV